MSWFWCRTPRRHGTCRSGAWEIQIRERVRPQSVPHRQPSLLPLVSTVEVPLPPPSKRPWSPTWRQTPVSLLSREARPLTVPHSDPPVSPSPPIIPISKQARSGISVRKQTIPSRNFCIYLIFSSEETLSKELLTLAASPSPSRLLVGPWIPTQLPLLSVLTSHNIDVGTVPLGSYDTLQSTFSLISLTLLSQPRPPSPCPVLSAFRTP